MKASDCNASLRKNCWPAAIPILLLTLLIACGDREPAPAVEGFAPVQGEGKLYYEVRGEGYPLVLIHGGSTHHGMWNDQFDLFARHYRTVRYDVRGWGASSTSETPHAAWDDLKSLLEHLEIERTHIVGLSLGGRIGVDFALEYPEMVDHLVLAGPGLSGWQFEMAPWLEEAIKALEAGNPRGATDAWLSSPYLEAAMEDPELAERLRQLTYDNEHFWTETQREVWPEPTAMERLGDLAAPTLLVLGSRDIEDIHRIVEMIDEQAPDARKVVLEGAGHMVNMEQPEEFNRAVLDFLPR